MFVILPKGIPSWRISVSVASFGTLRRCTTLDACGGEVAGDPAPAVVCAGDVAWTPLPLLLLLRFVLDVLLTEALVVFVLLLAVVVLLLLAVTRLLLLLFCAAAFSIRICNERQRYEQVRERCHIKANNQGAKKRTKYKRSLSIIVITLKKKAKS